MYPLWMSRRINCLETANSTTTNPRWEVAVASVNAPETIARRSRIDWQGLMIASAFFLNLRRYPLQHLLIAVAMPSANAARKHCLGLDVAHGWKLTIRGLGSELRQLDR